jgi:hypothetical protein
VDAVPVTAGWYADPLRVDVLRWWDGDGWSRHTAADATGAPEVAPFDASGLPAPDPEQAAAWDPVEAEESRRVAGLWRDAATRIRDLVERRTAVVHVTVDELAPIVIDTRYRAYGWRYPLTGLPPSPQRIAIDVVPSAPLAPTVFGMRNGAVAELLDVLEELARAEAA